MSIMEQIIEQVREAMKAGDKTRLAALRMMRARLQEAEGALRGEGGADYRLGAEEALPALGRPAR